jgi:hypothetical protein
MTLQKWQRMALWIVGTGALMYGMIYVDVVQRAKESYQEGEKYWQWTDHPEARSQFLNDKFTHEKATLDQQQAQGKLTSEDYNRALELLQFDHEQALKESTIKYAYVWYQTTVDLFSPPESKWVRLAREKMPLAKERWKSELRAKHIPFEEYMID